jgi:Tfp pilus assembly protein PilF
MRASRTVALIAVLAWLAIAPGCAAWKAKLSPQKTVADQREDRRDAAMQAFEQQRDAMQLQAAIDRFEQGDYTGCESRLTALVARRPDFLAARLRLAEILWARGEIAQAEEHYHAVLSAEPANSEAHHGLGMLLEAEGRFDEAAQHLGQMATEP